MNTVIKGLDKLPPAASKLFYQVPDEIAFFALWMMTNGHFSYGKIEVMENNDVTFQTNEA